MWQQLREALLAELNEAGALDWCKAVIDSSHVRALKGGPKPVRAPFCGSAAARAGVIPRARDPAGGVADRRAA